MSVDLDELTGVLEALREAVRRQRDSGDTIVIEPDGTIRVGDPDRPGEHWVLETWEDVQASTAALLDIAAVEVLKMGVRE